jgi:PAS domain S-box-containing protein
LITVAGNQATIALKDAHALAEQRRLAAELDVKVTQRTAELLASNEALKAEITERRRSEAFLAQAQRLTSTGSMWWDVASGKIIWSDETFELMQCPKTTTPTVELAMLRCHPEDAERVSDIIMRGTAAGTNMDFEHRLLMPDGTVKHVHVVLQNIANSTSPVFIGASTDITDRMNAERRLRRSETFLATGQKISQTGIFSWQVDTDELTFSEELNRIFEFEIDAVLTFDRIIGRVLPDDLPTLAEKMEMVRAGLDNTEYEIRLKSPDGGTKFVRVVAQLIRHKDGHTECLGAVQDVTQWRLAEEARDHLRNELARVASIMSLGEVAASIAHEVNQPLAGIVTNANTCVRMLTAEPPDIHEALETARRTIRDGNRAADVISRLRALFRKKTAAIEPVDLNEAAHEVVTLLRNNLRKEKIELQINLADDLPMIGGDRVQLQQVIMNFIRNAIEALGAIKDRRRSILVASETNTDDHVCLSVTDSGTGFAQAETARLFDAFYTTKLGGMGIGLSVSRSIIAAHKGRIWARQNDGPGATFGFSIPRYTDGLQ